MKILLIFITLFCFFSHCPCQAQWEKTQFPSTKYSTSVHVFFGKYFYVSTDGFSFFYRSSDHGYSWENIANSLPKEKAILGIITSGDTLIASLTDWNPDSTGGIYYSTDNAGSWVKSTGNGQYVSYLSKFYKIANFLYGEYSGQLIRSTDNGNNWKSATNGIVAGLTIAKLILLDSTCFASTYGEGIYVSSDTGKTWKNQKNIFLKDLVYDMVSVGNTLFATDGNLYKSSDKGNNWVLSLPKASSINSLIVHDGLLFASGDGVYCSRDTGLSWINITGNLPGFAAFIDADSEYLYGGLEWRRPLRDFAASVASEPAIDDSRFIVSIQNDHLVIQYYSKTELLRATLEIYDLLGRLMLSKSISNASQGWNSFDCDAHEIKNGSYVCRLSSSTFVLTNVFQIRK